LPAGGVGVDLWTLYAWLGREMTCPQGRGVLVQVFSDRAAVHVPRRSAPTFHGRGPDLLLPCRHPASGRCKGSGPCRGLGLTWTAEVG
jgi:hypothetical protein